MMSLFDKPTHGASTGEFKGMLQSFHQAFFPRNESVIYIISLYCRMDSRNSYLNVHCGSDTHT